MRSVGNVLLGHEWTKDAPLLSYGGRLHGGPPEAQPHPTHWNL